MSAEGHTSSWFSAPVNFPLGGRVIDAATFEREGRRLAAMTLGERVGRRSDLERLASMLVGRDYLTATGHAWVSEVLADTPDRRTASSATVPSHLSVAGLWTERPCLNPVFQALGRKLATWTPGGEGWDRVHAALTEAVECRADWLHHPAFDALGWTGPAAARGWSQMACVAAQHSSDLSSVRLTVDGVNEIWTEDGGLRLNGTLELEHRPRSGDVPCPSLDLWGELSASVIVGGLSRDRRDDPDLETRVIDYLAALRLIAEQAPDIHAWLLALTTIVTPLDGRAGQPMRSSTPPDQTAMIRTDLHGGVVLILESLVHESAHRLLLLREAQEPLIAESGRSALYWSPLRKDARPLRGLLLAWHALIHMTALYRRLAQLDARRSSELTAEADKLETSADDTAVVIRAAQTHFTDNGRAFLDCYL